MAKTSRCISKEYQYEFIYNNETYIADYCSNGRYGSYCTKDNITYSNVEYTSKVISCKDSFNKNDLSPFIPTLVFFAFILCSMFSMYKILFNILYGSDKK